MRERTFSDYSDIIQRRIKPRLGHMSLDKLSPLAVQAFYNKLADAGLSAKSIRNTHAVLHCALKGPTST